MICTASVQRRQMVETRDVAEPSPRRDSGACEVLADQRVVLLEHLDDSIVGVAPSLVDHVSGAERLEHQIHVAVPVELHQPVGGLVAEQQLDSHVAHVHVEEDPRGVIGGLGVEQELGRRVALRDSIVLADVRGEQRTPSLAAP
jgi:hypothetical protein